MADSLRALQTELTSQADQARQVNSDHLTRLRSLIDQKISELRNRSEIPTKAGITTEAIRLYLEVEDERTKALRQIDPQGVFPEPSKDYLDLRYTIASVFLKALDFQEEKKS